MPDIDFQRIELNLIPKKGEQPVVFYASQYETARPFIADLKWGNTEFAPGDDCWAEIDIRKNDDNLVVITDDVTIDNNEVSVILPVQAVTCIGKNLGQVKIYSDDDHLIAALNFILEVQPDPLSGGVTSETAIDNLESQIAAIVPEVIGEDYYDKTEVDNLLADKADVSDLPDMSLYYTKTATDTLLNAKADKSDTYTKAQVDSALSAKANTADLATVATSGDYDDLINKPVLPDMTQYYTKAEVDTLIDNIYPTLTASGDIATFSTALTKPLVSVTADPLATTITLTSKNLFTSMLTTTNDGITTSYDSSTGYISITNDSRTTNYGSGSMRSDVVSGLNSAHTYKYAFVPNISGVVLCDEYSLALNNEFTGITLARLKITNQYDFVNDHPIGDTTMVKLLIVDITEGSYITVPVADATTLTTLSGENNVYADAGSVTVQYKYMSI